MEQNLSLERLKKGRLNWLLVVILLTALIVCKLFYNPGLSASRNMDATYYAHLGKELSLGRGLTTRVSLWHQVLTLPHCSFVYPALPLALGLVGWITSPDLAFWLVPEAGYVAAVLLYLLLSVRVCQAFETLLMTPLETRAQSVLIPVLRILPALLLGSNFIFFQITSVPYTEALAIPLILLALLLSRPAITSGGFLCCYSVGLVLGLIFLTRSQMLFLLPPFFIVFLSSGPRWKEGSLRALALLLGWSTCSGVWFIYMSVMMPQLTFGEFFDFASYRELRSIPPFEWRREVTSVFAAFHLFLQSLVVAFNPYHHQSYFKVFGLTTLLPLVLVYYLPRLTYQALLRGEHERTSAALFLLLTAGSAVSALAPIHLTESVSSELLQWLFYWRHGLLFSLLVLVSFYGTVFLVPRTGIVILLFISASTIALGAWHLARDFKDTYLHASLSSEYPKMVQWIREQHPQARYLSYEPRILAYYSDAYFYWIGCSSTPTVAEQMLSNVEIDFVLTKEWELSVCHWTTILPKLARPVARVGDSPRMFIVWENLARRSMPHQQDQIGNQEGSALLDQYRRPQQRALVIQGDNQARQIEGEEHEPFTSK